MKNRKKKRPKLRRRRGGRKARNPEGGRILIFFFFFSSQNLVSDEILISAEIAGMTRNMPKYSFFSLLACQTRQSRVGAASEPCRRRVGACRRNEKKKSGRSPDTGIRRVVPVPVSDTCPTPTRRQKWRVRAT